MGADDAAFWIDYDYDRENAGDGVSRYGAYVRRSSAMASMGRVRTIQWHGQTRELSWFWRRYSQTFSTWFNSGE